MELECEVASDVFECLETKTEAEKLPGKAEKLELLENCMKCPKKKPPSNPSLVFNNSI